MRERILFMCLVFATAWAGNAWADEDYTGASGGNYDVGANWSGGTVPTNEEAYIRNGATVTLNATEPDATALWMGGPAGGSGSGTLDVLDGAALTTTDSFVVGNVNNGTVCQDGGALHMPYKLQVGYGGTGVFNMTAGTIDHGIADPDGDYSSRTIHIGEASYEGYSKGEFNLSGGSIHSYYASSEFTIGEGYDNIATYGPGVGTFNMTGGTLIVEPAISTGTSMIVGSNGGQGTFNYSGGSLWAFDGLMIAAGTAAGGQLPSGVMNMTAGSIYLPNSMMVGAQGSGKLNLSGGAILETSNGVLRIGGQASGSDSGGNGVGEANINGGTILHQEGSSGLQLGFRNNRGTLNLTDGLVYDNYRVIIGNADDVADRGLVTPDNHGLVNITGGSFIAGEAGILDSGLYIGFRGSFNAAPAKGTLNISGGVLNATEIRMLDRCPDPNVPNQALLRIIGDDASITTGGYTQNNQSLLAAIIDDDGISTIQVDGNAWFSSDSKLFVDFDSGTDPRSETWTLMDVASGSLSGSLSFAEGVDTDPADGKYWTMDFDTVGGALSVTYVPEPATLSLLALGGWAALRRRR